MLRCSAIKNWSVWFWFRAVTGYVRDSWMDLLEFTEPGLLPKKKLIKIKSSKCIYCPSTPRDWGEMTAAPFRHLMREHKVVMWQIPDSPTPNHCPVPALYLVLRLELVIYSSQGRAHSLVWDWVLYSVFCLSHLLKGARQAKIVI